MKCIKKVITTFLAIQLTCGNILFANPMPQNKISKQEIQAEISKTKEMTINISPAAAAVIVAGLGAAGYLVYKAGHFIGDVRGFGRGYVNGQFTAAAHYEQDLVSAKKQYREAVRLIEKNADNAIAAARIADKDAIKAANKVGFEAGYKRGISAGSTRTYQYINGDLPRPNSLITKMLEERAGENFSEELTKSLTKLASDIQGKDELSGMMRKVNGEINGFKIIWSKNGREGLAVVIENNVNEMLRLSKKSPQYIQRIVKQMAEETLSQIKGKGGILGLVLVAGLGAATFMSCSNEEQAGVISNKRAAAEKAILHTFENAPELLAAQVFVTSEMYGDTLVAGIVYEHSDDLWPVLLDQLKAMQSDEVRGFLADVMAQQADMAEKAAQAKQEEQLKKDLQDDSFMENLSKSFQSSPAWRR